VAVEATGRTKKLFVSSKPGTIGPNQPRSGFRWLEKGYGSASWVITKFVGYSTPRNLNDGTYTAVWLALFLDPIDRKHAPT
jgi:hypothetical protein